MGTPKHNSLKDPQFLKDFWGGGKLSEHRAPGTQDAFQNRTHLLSKFRHEDTWRKMKFNTFNLEMDLIWGCDSDSYLRLVS